MPGGYRAAARHLGRLTRPRPARAFAPKLDLRLPPSHTYDFLIEHAATSKDDVVRLFFIHIPVYIERSKG